jgi:transposase
MQSLLSNPPPANNSAVASDPSLLAAEPIGDTILKAVLHSHATEDTRLHALYAFYCVRMPTSQIAVIYGKSERTIKNWIGRYEANAYVGDADREVEPRKFSEEMQEWLVNYFKDNPTSYLDEAKVHFEDHWSIEISTSSVWRIIHNHGLSLKVRMLPYVFFSFFCTQQLTHPSHLKLQGRSSSAGL